MSNAETELKLLLPGAQATTIEARLRKLGVLARRRTSTHWLWNVYHDTPDQALRQQRHALRTRCISNRPWSSTASAATLRGEWVQTFKSAGISHGGLSCRGEWESRSSSDRPDPVALRTTPWTALDPDGRLFGELRPCFETRCCRTVWTLHRYHGATIEVALDRGEAVSNGRSEPILELELELKSGASVALFMLAKEIASVQSVLPCDVSKAERGYRLAQGGAQPAAPAGSLRLSADATPLEAAGQALSETFDQFTRNLSSLLVSDDPEVVHQARVAWRRWRSAVRLFAPWLPGRPDASGLTPLLDDLGRLRDLDVLRADTLGRCLPAFVGGDPGRQHIADRTLERIDQARSAQRERTRAALAQPATGLALLDLACGLFRLTTDAPLPLALRPSSKADAARPGKRRSGRQGTWAVRRIRKLQHRLEDALVAGQQPHAEPEQIHRARILAKRTRYAAEMLQDLLPDKRGKTLTEEATAVQNRLGKDRDLQQAVPLLEALQADAALIAFLRGVLACEALAGKG
ncbi:MAG: CYTH and CHAD domain-containing protein [Hydrogenophaga sp.]|uniref:CYTH and CHAD domain-containing protein n=1 Tax=Hydrogenophaga sp. TaxID=1904254 RepID=UPI0025BE5C7C|nr:CYTH and CHAD domain-containing protein [Hydrogenophaga sp.]MBT9552533.1 CYTH and CHAD domain-containing protein [Hydrogenophaga sp.]